VTADLITDDFRTPLGWRSGHLQTVRSRVVRRRYDLARYGSQRAVLVDLDDGTGDRLMVQVHRARRTPAGLGRRGLVALIHGLGGTAESDYVRATTQGLLAAGFNAARIDLRGAGLSGGTSALMYHAGRTTDLRAVLGHLAELPEAAGASAPAIAVMGFSLGGNAAIKLLGEPLDGLPVFGGVSVSAPLDLAVGAEHLHHMMFGMYERYLLSGLKRDSLRPGPTGELLVTTQERRLIENAKDIVDFDDAITARRNGWRDAAEYYAVNSSGQFLAQVTVPTLVIHSVDDPMIPVGPYRAIDWPALEAAGPVRRAITPRGGHVGFHERGNLLPWYVGRAVGFLSEADQMRA
jgi:predicted alpha/beta-fold hydrolase